ncbi:sialate O-acetylesterase [Thermostilla marina]
MRSSFAVCLLFGILASSAFGQGIPPNLPKEDVVEVPAIGDGLCVSNIFQTNMVIQRDKPIRVWGWASPGEKVTVSFAGHEATAEAGSDRAWEVVLPAVPVNTTPQTMVVRGKEETITLENILVGDVWVLGGQSNMEFPITNVDDGELEAASANFPQIRLLTTPQGKGFDSVHSFERLYEWSSWSKRHFRKGDWEICTPETVREFSAIGYVFGRRVHMATGVPIGLIDTSIGGTTVETWTPIDVLEQVEGAETRALLQDWAERIASYDPQADLQRRIEAYEARIKSLKERGEPIPPDSRPPNDLRPGPAADRNRPGYCYAGVIRPLEGFAVKGAVFHQGFNNCFSGSAGARMYYQVFGKMITAWRKAFDDPQMPFCIVSLCTAGAPQTLDNFLVPMYDVGPYIREAQYRTFRDFFDAGDPNIGFASTYDLRKSWYHPQIKIPAGERVAKWALTTQYGVFQRGGAEQFWLPPTIEKMEIVDGTIRLTLSTDVRTKDDADGKMLGFAIAGEDRIFYPAEVTYYTETIEGQKPRERRNILVLRSPFVDEPVHYRYAWARNPLENIVNGRGVPLATQRSDDWILEETPVKIEVPEGMSPDSARRYIAGRLRKVLEAADLERRLRTAQATVEELTPLVEKAKAALGN